MLKKLFVIALVLMSCAVFAQEKEVWLGVGRVLTSSNGNAVAYDTGFETNYNAGFRYKFNNVAFSATLTKDVSKIGKWLDRHNFVKDVSVKYEYIKISPRFEFHFKNFYALIGAPIFSSSYKDIKTKVGIEAGLGSRFYFTEHCGLQAETKFCHLQDFLVPVANTMFCDFAFIVRW